MRIDVMFSPSPAPGKEFPERAVAVIDVLRASNTIITALQNGCVSIIPAQDATEASELARRLSGDCVIGGERQGRKIDGFHFGNSPLEYTTEAVTGKTLVLTTTNGTKAIRAASAASHVVVVSLANLTAAAGYLKEKNRDVLIICSGQEGGFTLEDTFCAGALVEALKPDELGDAARVAQLVFKSGKKDPAGMIGTSDHAGYLASIGFEEDVRFCSQVDSSTIVPVLQESRLVAAARKNGTD